MVGRAVLGRVERLTPAGFATLVAVGVAMPAAATVLATGAVDWVLGGAALSWALAGLGAGVHRRRAARLPLELGETVLTGRVNGTTVYRFRARLGYGRPSRGPSHEVAFVPEAGDPVRLEVLTVPESVVGPWTVVAVDRDAVCREDGCLAVIARAREGAREWRAERSYRVADARAGWFRAPVRVGLGRLQWDDGTWDRIVGEESA